MWLLRYRNMIVKNIFFLLFNKTTRGFRDERKTVFLQSRVRIQRLPSPQLTADLLVRGNRGENYENEPLVRQNI